MAQVDISQLSKHTAHQHLAMAIKLTKNSTPITDAASVNLNAFSHSMLCKQLQ